MHSLNEIKKYTNKIADKFSPEKIILFGSAAKNKINENSDVDLLIIMDYKGRSVDQAFRIRKSIPSFFPLDLLVRNSEQVKDRIKKGDFFIKEILEEGVVLYERIS